MPKMAPGINILLKSMNKGLKFINKEKSTFLSALKTRVDNYFTEKKVSRHANGFMVFKTVFFISIAIGLYISIIASVFPPLLLLVAAILLGMTMAFNVCHDALHGAYSSNKKINKVLGFIFNIIGANAYVWNLTHNVVHHSYTNIVDHDEDIEIAPGLIRVNETDKANKLHRFQHIYAFFLYGLTTLSWFFRKDYVKFFQKTIGDSHINKHPKAEYYKLFIFIRLFIISSLLCCPCW
jgi:linoleoyl-CoA desaturase